MKLVHPGSIGWLAALAGLWSGCARRPPLPSPAPGVDPCVVTADPVAARLDTVSLAVDAPVQPSELAVPDGAPERLVARQVYAGLARLDCDGRVVPDLALGWKRDAGGGGWIVEVRPDARFGDGSLVDAEAVRSGWLAGDSTREWMTRGLLRAEVLGVRTLRVGFAETTDSAPALLADPALAVRGPPTAGGSPASSGPYRPADSRRPELILTPIGSGPVLRIVPLAGAGDPRDALDRSSSRVDLLVTRDPTILGYAAGRDELVVVPLPWDRTYALRWPGANGEAPDLATRDGLARDAVRSEARGAVPPFWWESDPACQTPDGELAPTSTGTVAYAARDDIARSLAERIVALAGPARPAWLAEPGPDAGPSRVEARDAAALRAGGAAVVALSRVPRVACRGARLGQDSRLVPLIDSRARVVIRRGSPALRIEGDGSVRVLPR